MKSLTSKSKYIIFAGLMATFAVLVGFQSNWSSRVLLNNLFAALPVNTQNLFLKVDTAKPDFYIMLETEDKKMSDQYVFSGYDKASTKTVAAKLASSYTFTSYSKTSTNPVPVKSFWAIKSDTAPGYAEVGVKGVSLEGCVYSEKCIVHTGTYPQKLLLTSTLLNKTVTARINVTSEIPPNPFKDNVPDWARATVFSLYRMGIVKGYADGSYGSSDPVTRGQAVLMLYNLMLFHELDPSAFLANKSCDGIYSDVKNPHYAAKSICLGSHLGWFKGFVSGKEFKPDEPIKRHEAAQLIFNIITAKGLEKYFSAEDLQEESFLSKLGHAFYEDVNLNTPNVEAISALSAFEVMKGSKGNFRPLERINRAEMAQLIQNVAAHMKDKN